MSDFQFHIIYETTCLITGLCYIGKHTQPKGLSPFEFDGYFGSGKQVKKSIEQYGTHAHIRRTIAWFSNSEDALASERAIVTSLKLLNPEFILNIANGGKGEWPKEATQAAHSENSKNKIANTKSKNGTTGWSKEAHAKANSESSRLKRIITLSQTGHQKSEKNSQFGTCWITKDSLNKKIQKSNFPAYEELGWAKGRTLNSAG